MTFLKFVDGLPVFVDEANYDLEGCHLLRKDHYPSIETQLDILFHSGIEGWKASIQAIKDRYPKPVI